jgi:hypothetical protein
MHVRARVLDRRAVPRLAPERGERLEPARERLVDFPLDPGQGTQVEFGSGFGLHGLHRRRFRQEAVATP